jgi:ADP-ribosylglycohydrolase
LTAAGHDGEEFAGYVIAVCDFTHGHGQYFVSNFNSFTNGALMLVVSPLNDRGRRITNRAAGVPESFGQ